MILIICSSNDNGVVKVCKWLKYFGHNVTIISERNIVKYDFSDQKLTFYIDGSEYKNFKTGWIRNPHLTFDFGNVLVNKQIDKIAKNYINSELQKNQDFVFNYLKNNRNFLGTVYSLDINKLVLLESAIALGIKVPQYLITTSKYKLIEFKKKYDRVITKSIGWNINFSIGQKKYFGYTQLISDSFLKIIPIEFQQSFFQEYIKADFELRVVVLENKVFTMAYNKSLYEGKIDIRETDQKTEVFALQLPNKIELLLQKLMKVYNIDFCVFDILLKDSMFYLIDINPTGQFTGVSQNCNYNIELEIAKILIHRYETFSTKYA